MTSSIFFFRRNEDLSKSTISDVIKSDIQNSLLEVENFLKKKPEVIDLKKKEVQVEFEKSWNQQPQQLEPEVIDISDDDDQPKPRGSSNFLPSSSSGIET